MSDRLPLHFLFFISGCGGLIYEVIWVRQFGFMFGSTVHSVALVTGLFMLGLGAGGWFFGRFADERFLEDPSSPLRWYGRLELCIAALALGVALVLPRFAIISGVLSSYVADPASGWHHLSLASSMLRYGAAVLLIGPLTILMGGTLSLLIRHVVARNLDVAGWRIGTLYGANTAGAALGCLLTDLALVPSVGVFFTQGIAVGLNLTAGAGALWLARAEARSHERPISATTMLQSAPAVEERTTLWLVSAAVLLTGLASMGMQVVWFRHLVSIFGGFRSVFSLLLTVILCGLWLGSFAGGWLARTALRPATSYAVAQVCFVISALGALALFEGGSYSVVSGWFETLRSLSLSRDAAFRIAVHAAIVIPMLGVVGLPTVFMGVAFPLANASVQRVSAEVGRRAGVLYLANTVGGVAGSLLTGFLLLPTVGTQTSTLALVACSAASILPLGLVASATGTRRSGAVSAVAAATCLLALVAWTRLPEEALVQRTLRVGKADRVLAVSEGVNETISILENPNHFRTLETNGHFMSGTNVTSQRYMRAFAHVPLLLQQAPHRAMVMCFGVGTTLQATLLHPSIESVDLVDYSEHVLHFASYFEATNKGALNDPRVHVFVNDARQHLRMMPEASYDLITGEPPPIAYAGVVSLYTREFFALARSRLRPGGFLSYWLPIDQVTGEVALAVVRAFVDAFPNAVLLSGYRHQLILLGSASPRPLQLDPKRLARKLEATPEVALDLARVWLKPLELVGTFVAPSRVLRLATTGVAPVSDAWPVLEYGAVLFRPASRIPATLFAPLAADGWCPNCLSDPESPVPADSLRSYLHVMQRLYASKAFLYGRPGLRPPPLRLSRREREVLRGSRYIRHLAGPGFTAGGKSRGEE